MITEPVPLAPDYLLKHYSSLNKQTYKSLLRNYYNDGCRQSRTGIIRYYYKNRVNDLKESDLSLKEALKLIDENKYTVYCYCDVSNPYIMTWITEILF